MAYTLSSDIIGPCDGTGNGALRLQPWPREAGVGSIAIVDNSPALTPSPSAIDAADIVVRFNNAAGFGGPAGRRVTHLALVNFGGQMRQWLESPDFIHSPAVAAAEEFVFPFQPGTLSAPLPFEEKRKMPGELDWTIEAHAMLRPLGRPVRVLSSAVHDEGRDSLARLAPPDAPPPIPSTGFLVATFFCDRFDCPVDLYGFGFAGWDGHSWQAERAWAEAMARRGRLRLHPLQRSGPGAPEEPGRVRSSRDPDLAL